MFITALQSSGISPLCKTNDYIQEGLKRNHTHTEGEGPFTIWTLRYVMLYNDCVQYYQPLKFCRTVEYFQYSCCIETSFIYFETQFFYLVTMISPQLQLLLVKCRCDSQSELVIYRAKIIICSQQNLHGYTTSPKGRQIFQQRAVVQQQTHIKTSKNGVSIGAHICMLCN